MDVLVRRWRRRRSCDPVPVGVFVGGSGWMNEYIFCSIFIYIIRVTSGPIFALKSVPGVSGPLAQPRNALKSTHAHTSHIKQFVCSPCRNANARARLHFLLLHTAPTTRREKTCRHPIPIPFELLLFVQSDCSEPCARS